MSEFKGLGKKLGKTAAKAIKKTEEVADIAVKYVKLRSIDAKLDERYEVLGKLTYKQLKTGESQAERIALYIESIDKLRADRKALQAEIEAEKAKEDVEVEIDEEPENE
jgi:hypothetical protein